MTTTVQSPSSFTLLRSRMRRSPHRVYMASTLGITSKLVFSLPFFLSIRSHLLGFACACCSNPNLLSWIWFFLGWFYCLCVISVATDWFRICWWFFYSHHCFLTLILTSLAPLLWFFKWVCLELFVGEVLVLTAWFSLIFNIFPHQFNSVLVFPASSECLLNWLLLQSKLFLWVLNFVRDLLGDFSWFYWINGSMHIFIFFLISRS